jgi:aspartate carbamoyltransferase catalytic subunit
MATNHLFHTDILSVEQLSLADIDLVMKTAQQMKKMVRAKGATDILKGKMMTALFYEPSSRTFASFVTAMQRLGGGFIPLQGVTYSSVSKGETLSDTVQTFASYSDIIVIRHPEVGSAKIAAEFSSKPVINAGDGVGEHPTQALLDLFTIKEHFGKIEGITITMVGDLLNGRTVHSLTKLLSLYTRVTFNFVSPELLRLPAELVQKFKEKNITITQTEKLDDVLPKTDVLYVTRVQKERFTDLASYERLKHRYIITSDIVRHMKQTAIVMHPFPRVGEIDNDVDLDPRAVYIKEEMPNGMYVRMALLSLILLEK